MNQSFRVFFLTGALLFAFAATFAGDRVARYGITVLGRQIGELAIKQSSRNDTTTILATTDVEVKILIPFRVKLIQNSVHLGGELYKYSLQTQKNNKPNSDTRMWREGEGYLLVKNGDSTRISENIPFSGSLFYFNEPRNVTEVFNERVGKMEALQKTGDQTYFTLDEKGKKQNEYRYRNGTLEMARLHHTLATVQLQRLSDDEFTAK